MTPEERARVRDLVMKAKTAQALFPADLAFIEQMFNEHPDEYVEVADEVHEEVMESMNPLYRRKK